MMTYAEIERRLDAVAVELANLTVKIAQANYFHFRYRWLKSRTRLPMIPTMMTILGRAVALTAMAFQAHRSPAERAELMAEAMELTRYLAAA